MTLLIEPAAGGDLAAIVALLGQAQLPHSDLGVHSLAQFLVARVEGATGLVAAVGIEAVMPSGLLRSLVVADTQRGLGLGAKLLEAVEARARELGIEELILLTTSAEPFFVRHGYARIARADAPLGLRATSEFASLCPASAVCMRKRLRA